MSNLKVATCKLYNPLNFVMAQKFCGIKTFKEPVTYDLIKNEKHKPNIT